MIAEMKVIGLLVDFLPGDRITDCIFTACNLASASNLNVALKVNGVWLVVDRDSKLSEVLAEYDQGLKDGQ